MAVCPAWLGFCASSRKRAGTAAIPNCPEGLLIGFDLVMSDVVTYGHKKSLLTQAPLFLMLSFSGYFAPEFFSFVFLVMAALTGVP
jgi:hypothetical protein